MKISNEPPLIATIDRFREEHGRHLLVVRIRVAPGFPRFVRRILGALIVHREPHKTRRFSTVYPEENRIGLLILSRALELALDNASESCLPPMWFGTLTDGDIVLPVKSDARALEIVQEELKALTISHFASYGTFDFERRFWKGLAPEPGGFFEAPREDL